MAEETFVALAQFHLGRDRIVKIGEEFEFEHKTLREMGCLCGPNPQAVRKGDPRISAAVKAEKVRVKRAAEQNVSAAELRAKIEKIERQFEATGTGG